MKLAKCPRWNALVIAAPLIAAPLVVAASCGGAPPPAPAPVTPAPTSTASSEPEPQANTHRIRDIVQPVKIEKQEIPPPPVEGDPNGVEGSLDDDLQGVIVAPPPPPPAPPQNVAPTSLDRLRIAGDRSILPDDDTKAEIASSGKAKIIGSYKLCVTAEGNVSSVMQLKSTGFPMYDAKIINSIRGEWRFQPFLVGGVAKPVCTAVTFIYSL